MSAFKRRVNQLYREYSSGPHACAPDPAVASHVSVARVPLARRVRVCARAHERAGSGGAARLNMRVQRLCSAQPSLCCDCACSHDRSARLRSRQHRAATTRFCAMRSGATCRSCRRRSLKSTLSRHHRMVAGACWPAHIGRCMLHGLSTPLRCAGRASMSFVECARAHARHGFVAVRIYAQSVLVVRESTRIHRTGW